MDCYEEVSHALHALASACLSFGSSHHGLTLGRWGKLLQANISEAFCHEIPWCRSGQIHFHSFFFQAANVHSTTTCSPIAVHIPPIQSHAKLFKTPPTRSDAVHSLSIFPLNHEKDFSPARSIHGQTTTTAEPRPSKTTRRC